MTIDEAIKILIILKEPESIIDTEKFHKAVKLGVEGLKRLKTWRKNREGNPDMLLPGETKE